MQRELEDRFSTCLLPGNRQRSTLEGFGHNISYPDQSLHLALIDGGQFSFLNVRL